MSPLETLMKDLEQAKRDKASALSKLKWSEERIEQLEEAIEHLKYLPRYQEVEEDE